MTRQAGRKCAVSLLVVFLMASCAEEQEPAGKRRPADPAPEDRPVAVRSLKSPSFHSTLPRVFTDICWDPHKVCFMLINDEAMAEFFMAKGTILAKSFISSTGKYSLRGWTFVAGKSCVIDGASMTVQLSISRRKTKTFPLNAGDSPSALTWDGTRLWSADSGTNRLYKHAGEAEQFRVVDSFPAAGKRVCGLAWDGARLWSCDSDRLFVYDKDMTAAASYLLPVHVSGITWRGRELWASDRDEPAIHKIEIPLGEGH